MGLVWAALFTILSGTAAVNPLEARLDHQMKFWQKRLGLQEWSLTLRVVRQTQIDSNAWGEAEWNPEAKTGLISVLDPRDYNLKGDELRQDMECTIVHELVHIQVSPLDAKNANVRERVVNQIMSAVLNRDCPN